MKRCMRNPSRRPSTNCGAVSCWAFLLSSSTRARICAIHLNDSKKDLGSGVDRHEHIGQGYIGTRGFAFLLNDPRLAELPMVLETPKEDNADVRNLATLRSLI